MKRAVVNLCVSRLFTAPTGRSPALHLEGGSSASFPQHRDTLSVDRMLVWFDLVNQSLVTTGFP